VKNRKLGAGAFRDDENSVGGGLKLHRIQVDWDGTSAKRRKNRAGGNTQRRSIEINPNRRNSERVWGPI